jgi:hypothetical protein
MLKCFHNIILGFYSNKTSQHKNSLKFVCLCAAHDCIRDKYEFHTNCCTLLLHTSMQQACNEPSHYKMYLLCEISCTSEVWYNFCRDNESKSIFKLQKRVWQIISGVSKQLSCRQLFKDFNILPVACIYII